MTIYQFIDCAQVMRNGGVCIVGCPPRYNYLKRQAVRHRKLEEAYSALWGFRVKHPDSTRSRRARQRDLMRHQARILKVAA